MRQKGDRLRDVQVARGGGRHLVLVRVADLVYQAAQAEARRRGLAVSTWIGMIVAEYLEGRASK
jgi:hypothetical protein